MTAAPPSIPDRPWAADASAVTGELAVEPDRGLSADEVAERRDRFGPNRLREHARRSAWSILADQFRGLIIWLLVSAGVLAALWGEWIESGAIGVVLLINGAIGFFTELRAVRSMEALRELGQVTTRVRRDGEEREVPADELVPGDIVLLEGGDVVTADLRLLEASKLQANESTLTGESVPVGKATEPVAPDTILAERASMLFKGTAVTRGAGTAVVVATGMETELGEISALVEEAEEESTPLQHRLESLGRRLVFLTLGMAAAVTVTGILGGQELLLMIETGIALAVAAVPEGLPVVATIALARGMRLMARRNALLNRLSSVETLGTTDVIFTDKTGTLTENRMTVVRFVLPSGVVDVEGGPSPVEGEFRAEGAPIDPLESRVLREALETGVLCNNASLPGDSLDEAAGDPTEVALLVAGAKAGLSREALRGARPERREEAFDPEVKMMATFHSAEGEDGLSVAVKGAPDAVLPACTRARTEDGSARALEEEDRDRWLDENERLAAEGLRVLGLATRRASSIDEDPYRELVFVGLVAMQDPPRGEVREAIEACRTAGIDVVMVTGDQPATARGIGLAVGLVSEEAGEPLVVMGRELERREAAGEEGAALPGDEPDAGKPREEEWTERISKARIFARVSPRHKLELIAQYRGSGHVVAMTGDGVNDAPALKKADIGVAMGARGTQVAKEAADMILADDQFGTIVTAIEQGRIIFDNIRRFALYLLSCNASEVMVVGAATLVGGPLPVLPLQLLFLNFVTDVFPALALGAGKGEPGIMRRPPRPPGEAILARRHWIRIGLGGTMITLAVLAALGLALGWLGLGVERAVTVSFLTLATAQLWHVFNMRSARSGALRNEVTRNPLVWGALGLCGALLVAAVYLPGVSDVLRVSDPGRAGWALALGLGLLPLLLGQLVAALRRPTD